MPLFWVLQVRPGEIGLWILSLGVPYAHLIKAFKRFVNELGWNFKGFSDMRVEEISRLTGLDEEASRLAVNAGV